MKNIEFPIFKTKVEGSDKTFDLTDYKERKEYFEFKAGKEIKKLKDFWKRNLR